MNKDQYEQLTRWINAHADGLLDEAQKQTFEQARSKNAAIRAELECQAQIDETIRRIFAPPTADDILKRIHGDQSEPAAVTSASPAATGRARISPWVWRTAIAAAVILLATGGWWAWLMTQDAGVQVVLKVPELPKLQMEQVYQNLLATGFKPKWVCSDEKEFATTFYFKLGQGLVFDHAPVAIAMVGLSYANCVSRDTVVFLADVHGEKVIVLVDKSANDKDFTLAGDSRLHLFKRQVGSLMLYEVSPLAKPALLDYFHEKEIPAEWKTRPGYRP
jgi:hypothetical protein